MANFFSTGRSLQKILCKSNLYFSSVRGYSGSPSTIGFIGLGNMGGSMVKNLLKNKNKVVVCDISPEAVKEATDAGATSESLPSAVANQSGVIVTMLPNSPEILSVYAGPNGIFETVKPGTILIDSSTIDTSVAQEVAGMATEKSATYLDAPVSGGVLAARDGTLTFMVGGPAKEVGEAEKVLKDMGTNIVHCGDVGTGQAAKICNNMLLGISMMAVSETMNLGSRLGLDPKMLTKIINMSSGRCWATEIYHPCPGVKEGVPSNNAYNGGFGSALMVKDLGLAQNAATGTKSPTPLGSAAHQMYRMMCHHGYGKLDFSSVYKFIQENQKD